MSFEERGKSVQNSSYSEELFPLRSQFNVSVLARTEVPSEGLERSFKNIVEHTYSTQSDGESKVHVVNKFESSISDSSTRNDLSYKRSLPPANGATPRNFGKLNKSMRAISSTRRYVVEHFGPQIPRAVIESLIYTSGAKVNSSVNINPECGWGWYVCGRKLLVWPVLPSSEKIPPTVIARELNLPSSDLAHSANLVAVYVENGNNAASCIAVTPEGLVRCWPIIGQHSSYHDVNTHLGGEEVCAVRYIPPLGCLAVTTTASMILLTPIINKGLPSITVNHISVPQGWISGISRKVSSIIFGGLPPAQGLESRIVKVLTKKKSNDSWHVFLLSGLILQSWNVNKGIPHEMFFECDLTRMIGSAFQDPPNDENEIVVLDMRYSDVGLLLLAVSCTLRSYAIVEVGVPNEKTIPTDCTRLCALTQQDILTIEGGAEKIANLQFLPLTASALVFNNKVVLGVKMMSGNQTDADRLDIPGGLVIGGHMYDKIPVFFSATHGFMSVTPTDTSCMDVINSSVADISIAKTFFEIEGADPVVDHVVSLKTAFIYYVRKNINLCKTLVSRAFPSGSFESPVDSPLATTLVKVSLDIINDASSKDPRWGDTKETAVLPGAVSLLLENQLIEKQQAHDLFLMFAKNISLSEDLGKVTRKHCSTPVKTMLVLYEHNEKITAAIAIRKLQKEHSDIVRILMGLCCTYHKFNTSGDISSQDFFYRHICYVDDGLRALCTHCEQLMMSQISIPRCVEVVMEANNILVEVSRAVINRREEMGRTYADSSYVPWLSAAGPEGLFDYMKKQSRITLSIICDYKSGKDYPEVLRNQLLYLCDAILYTQKDYPPAVTYNELRSNLIRPFIQINELDKAVMLAEKFKDFDILIDICFRLNDEARLNRYFEKFVQEGFCEFTFEWCIREKKVPQLLALPLPSEFYCRLTTFLEKYPKFAWIHTVRSADFVKSAELLSKIGLRTSKFALRKERILALAKMAACASDQLKDFNPEVSAQLQVLRVQRKLPTSVLQKYGFQKVTARAFSTKELIQLFTCEDNTDAKFEDFIIAFKLLSFLDQDEAIKVRNDIWAKAVKRDHWDFADLTPPDEEINRSFVFNLMSIASVMLDAEKLIPTIEEILAHDDLQHLSSNNLFRYIMTYGFEMFQGITETPLTMPTPTPSGLI